MHFLKRNLVNVSDEKWGPLSVDGLLGFPYCEMSWLSLLIIVFAVLL